MASQAVLGVDTKLPHTFSPEFLALLMTVANGSELGEA
jgi:hypothetical protein